MIQWFVSRSNQVCVILVVLCVDSVNFGLKLFCLWIVEIALVWYVVCDAGSGCQIGKYSQECNQTSENETFSLRKFCIINILQLSKQNLEIFVSFTKCVWQRGWKHEMIDSKLLSRAYFKSIIMRKSGQFCTFISNVIYLPFFLLYLNGKNGGSK